MDTFEYEINDEYTITFKIGGEIDLSRVPSLKLQIAKQLENENYKAVILNLSKITYIDSSGVSMLIYVRDLATSSDAEFIISSPSEIVQTILKLVKLDSFFYFDM